MWAEKLAWSGAPRMESPHPRGECAGLKSQVRGLPGAARTVTPWK